MLPQILTAAILNVALNIIRDLDDVRALSGALNDDLTARANSGGQAVDLMHAHAHAIVLTYTHAYDLTRADAITHTCAADPDFIRILDLAGVRALADTIACDLASAIDLARTRAVELADAIDLDLSVLSAFDFDIGQAIDIARVHASDLDRAGLLARSVTDDPDPDFARVFGLTGVRALDPALPLPGVLELSLRWIAEGPLASTLLQVLAETSPSSLVARPMPGDPYLAFALVLSSRAGIHETMQLTAALGSPLTDALRDVEVAESRKSDDSPDWNRVTGFGRVRDACVPMCAMHQPPSPPEAAALRAVALALANGATVPGSDAPNVMRTVAATVTLIENRSKGESKAGESIILTLV
jgi:hypothetical protein